MLQMVDAVSINSELKQELIKILVTVYDTETIIFNDAEYELVIVTNALGTFSKEATYKHHR
ncbi:MAG: hypothetical protein ACTIDE_09585 [Carnobacterium maltaromaticum]